MRSLIRIWTCLQFAPSPLHDMDGLLFGSVCSGRNSLQVLDPGFPVDDPPWEWPVRSLPTPTDVPIPEPNDVPVPEPIDVPVPEPKDVPPPNPRNLPAPGSTPLNGKPLQKPRSLP